jgi:hypothetical protein
VAALAPSSSQHRSLQDEAPIMRGDSFERRKKIQPEEDKKTAEEDFLNRIF